MNYSEEARVFTVADEQLVGVLARPEAPTDCGVLIIVGGPQYRAGSHRQFLLLSRRLAAEGFSCMRFDYRGMGDSDGAMRSFEEVCEDISAGVDVLQQSCPEVKRIVLWGLCDAASASLLYMQATRDERIAGLVLLNPWVRSEASLAQTHIKHYYGQRLMQREFWFKLLSGKMQLLTSVRGFLNSAQQARGKSEHNEFSLFQDRMAAGLREFKGKVLLILSGEDYTAKEFIEYAASSPSWFGLTGVERILRIDVPDADHTFSSSAQRSTVEHETIKWCKALKK